MPTLPLVSIITISYDPTAKTLEKQLTALAKQDRRDFEYILVDSGAQKLSSQALQSSALVKKIPTAIIPLPSVAPQKFNYAAAYNAGIKKACGQVVVRSSADAIPASSDWLQNLLEPFGKNPQIGIVFGKLKNINAGNKFTAVNQVPAFSYKVYDLHQNLLYKLTQPPTTQTYHRFPLVTGACFAFRRSLWQAHSFNPAWRWGEEYEFANFAQKQGFTIHYTPHARTFHSHTSGLLPGLKRIFKDLRLVCRVLLLWVFNV